MNHLDGTPMRDLRDEGRMKDREHDVRMAAARRRSEWELGDASYAGLIMAAYMNPAADAAALDAEGVDVDADR